MDNKPTANVIVWSVLSLIALLGGIGLLFGAFGRWNILGWHGREQASELPHARRHRADAGAASLRVVLLVMAALFVLQTLVGAASQHYRAELALLRDQPGRALSVQPDADLARAAGDLLGRHLFVAAGIFLAPMIARREPRGQGKLAFMLLGALAVVVFER